MASFFILILMYKQMIEMMDKYFPDAEYREYSYLDYANSSPMRDGLEIRTFLNELNELND